MFPVTHLYFYSLIFPVNVSSAIGAVFPDTSVNSGLNWQQAHYTMEFFNRITEEEKEEFSDFIWGMLTHSVDSYGLDYYGDEKYGESEKGYSYIRSETLVPDVVKVCRIPESMGEWKAHNFIEMGIESLVSEEHPEIREWIEEVRHDKDEIKRLTWFLSRHFPTDRIIMEKSIKVFFDRIVSTGDPLDLAIRYQCQLDMRHGIGNVNPAEVARIINRARDMIKDEYFDFLMECRDKFLSHWRHLIMKEKNEEKVR
jgi:hypothetical protein